MGVQLRGIALVVKVSMGQKLVAGTLVVMLFGGVCWQSQQVALRRCSYGSCTSASKQMVKGARTVSTGRRLGLYIRVVYTQAANGKKPALQMTRRWLK